MGCLFRIAEWLFRQTSENDRWFDHTEIQNEKWNQNEFEQTWIKMKIPPKPSANWVGRLARRKKPMGYRGILFPLRKKVFYFFSNWKHVCPVGRSSGKTTEEWLNLQSKANHPRLAKETFSNATQIEKPSPNPNSSEIPFQTPKKYEKRFVCYYMCLCTKSTMNFDEGFFSSANISCVLRKISRSRCSQGLSWPGPPCHDLYPCSFLCWHCCCRLCMDHRAFALCLLLCLFSCRCPGCWPHSFSGAFQDVSHSFCDQLSHCLFLTCSDCC